MKNLEIWLERVCNEHGVKAEFFKSDLVAAQPKTEQQATDAMSELLYSAWHNNFNEVWISTDETMETL